MDFIAFDIETTGTVAGVDRIIEIGFVKFINGQADSTFSTLVDPQVIIPEEATRVNKITNAMVKGKPTVDRILPSLTDFCGQLPLVAHNALFDLGFLVQDYLKYEISTPKGVVIDTLPLARKLIPGLPNYKLGTLVSHFNISSGEFHRAQEDAMYCGEVYLKLLEKIVKGSSVIDIDQIISLTGKPAQHFPLVEKKPKQLNLFGP